MDNTLPVHPQPMPDELFSSWVYRVARANGQNVFSFCYLIMPEIRSIYYNLDHMIALQAVKKLAKLFNTPFLTAWETTLESYSGKLFEASTPKANRKTCVLHTGSQKNAERRYCLQYCPLCLSEGECYYRKKWRVSFITVCCTHGCHLCDRCPECGSPIRPLLNDLDQPHKMPFLGDISQCFQCQFNLKNTKVKKADDKVVKNTLFYEDILLNGFIQLENMNRWIYSFSFFQVLRHLMRLSLRKVSVENDNLNIHNPDMLPQNLRYQCICALIDTFLNWPSKFVALCDKNKFIYSDFTNNRKKKPITPYWLEKVVRQHLYSPNAFPSEQCITAAIDYLIKHNKRLNASVINRLLGYEDSGVIKAVLKKHQRTKLFHLPYMRKPR